MKKSLLLLVFLALYGSLSILKAQDEASAKVKEAEKAYDSHNLDNARFALQQAMNELNTIIGKEILEVLPTKLNEIAYNPKEDNITGASGVAGLFVNRTYGAKDGQNDKIEIMGDSPMLAALNSMLAMPMGMGTSNSNEKQIKVGGYKSVLKKDVGQNNVISYTIQIPLNQNLLTFLVKGIDSEDDVVSLANTLPLDKIANIAK